MKRLFQGIICLVLLLQSPRVLSQTDEQAYSEEFTYGINFNTNAGLIGGFELKWSKLIKERQYQCYGIGIYNVKHPKEYRFRNDASGNSFIAYKTNYLFPIRPFYGREFLLFRKASEEGVHINLILAGGPTLGILKPYHVLYIENNLNPNSITSLPYTEDLNLNQIYGVGNLTDGLEQSKLNLGGHLRSSLTFEFGQIKSSVIGLEVGLLVEKFAQEQKIMAFAQNRSVYFSSFLTLYYGRKY